MLSCVASPCACPLPLLPLLLQLLFGPDGWCNAELPAREATCPCYYVSTPPHPPLHARQALPALPLHFL